MTSTTDHYEQHLGPIYLWMAGGADAALDAGRAELQAIGVTVGPDRHAVDLGAGFGMHAIPLAQAGASVVAIDTSAVLLRALDELRAGAPVRVVCDDLLAFPRHLTDRPDLILCLGDTITHLPDLAAVESLVRLAADALRPGGTFAVSLRDYSVPLAGNARFIPVRSDDTRLLTCFLEYDDTGVVVHDILHERASGGWTTRVSHYRKLRLAIPALTALLDAAGFDVRHDTPVRGMVRLVATRRSR